MDNSAQIDTPNLSQRKEEIMAFCDQAWEARDTDPGLSRSLSQQAYDLATTGPFEQEQFTTGMAGSLRNLGYLDMITSRRTDGLHNLLRGLAALGTDPQPAIRTDLLRCIAYTFLEIGSYAEGLEYAYKALELAVQMKDENRQAFVWDAIGGLYGELKHADKAVSAEENALKLYRQAGNSRGEAIVLNNIAATYIQIGEKEKALRSAQTSRELAEKQGIPLLALAALGTFGEIWLEIGDYEQASQYLHQYHDQAQKLKASSDIAFSLFLLGKTEYLRGEYSAAHSYLEQAVSLATSQSSPRVRSDCLKLLSATSEHLDDLKSALQYFREYNALNSELFSHATIERISMMQVFHQIETAQKDAEIYRLQTIALSREIERRKAVEEELLFQSTHDALTGLYNRSHFEKELLRLEHEVHPVVSLVMLDLDNYKQINDLMGHLAGDQFLAAFATCLRKSMRPEDFIARLGGDEFAVLLPGVNMENLVEVVERMRSSLEQLIQSMPPYATIISVSIGWAVSQEAEELENLLKRANKNMYLEKSGKHPIQTDHP
jgi:diguanylate cyclase (GGDEF)-like protein